MMIRILGCNVVALCLGAVGCREADQIHAYDVPKEVATHTEPVAVPSAATDRMLAAVLPDADRAWFFKVTGPLAEIDSRADQIREFFAGVRLAPGKPHPDWQLPADWQEQPASAMRAATFLIPAGDKPLELSVSVLPWPGGADAMLSNVNRWRGQLQLAPTDARGLGESTHELKVGDATMTVVDLRGRMTGGMPPFAGGPMANAPPAIAAPPTAIAEASLPPGHPPVGAPSTLSTAPFQFEVPTGWRSVPATGMRKVELRIGEGDPAAVLTAIDFPASAGPMMADPTANLNRWRIEVGLPALAQDAAKKAIKPFKIDGGEAMFMAAMPDASQPGQSQATRGTLAAMFRRGDTIWFFKFIGDRDRVAAERQNFESFLKSVRFSDDGGASDGDQ
jgi:hypothetical protein